jgi:acetate kinase
MRTHPKSPTALAELETAARDPARPQHPAAEGLQATSSKEAVVVFNAGSTSLKFAAYQIDSAGKLPLLCRGRFDGMHGDSHFVAKDAAGKSLPSHKWREGQTIDHKVALRFLIDWLETDLAGIRVAAAGHRVVLGGSRFEAPTRLDAEALDYLDSLSAIEPSHQPYNVRGARAFAEAFPGRPQVACFDTSFHRSMPEVAQTYALPQDVRDAGVCHWGFHGISYEYISRQLPSFAPMARRVVVAHLGGGASLCAMLDGRSIETSMGFGTLSGLPMATRPGDVPPDALLYLLRSKLFDEASLEKMLYERSGLLGLSGTSGDMRELQDSDEPRAKAALESFVYAMQKYTGAYAAVLGGLDAFVFTAGIGENSPVVRAALCERMAWLGVRLDAAANAAGGPRISTNDSKVSVWVIPTDEEMMVAQHALALLRPQIEQHSP